MQASLELMGPSHRTCGTKIPLETGTYMCLSWLQGCDGSILLDGQPGVPNERASFKNFGMRNFKYFYALKKHLEDACPGVVSCADLVALTGVYSIHIVSSDGRILSFSLLSLRKFQFQSELSITIIYNSYARS